MTDDQRNQPTDDAHPGDITRRDFATLLVGMGLAATVQPAAAASLELAETDVEIKTPDERATPHSFVRKLVPIREC